MSIVIIITLIVGIFAGANATPWVASVFDNMSGIILYILIFSVGIDIGLNSDVFKKIKKIGIKILLIPFGIAVGSIIGGIICSFIFKMQWNEGAAISAGMGWYSLSGALISEAGYPVYGTISFLSNVFREILTFIIVPFVARNFNYYCAIAPAGATSMDTTLAVISRNTNGKIAIIAFISGITLSAIVPIVIPILI